MKLTAAFTLAAAYLLTSCTAPELPKPRPPQPLLTAADHDKTVNLLIGETVHLHLESNPTTGYSWNSLQLPDGKIVKQTHHAYQGPAETNQTHMLVGAGGVEHWKFLAVAEGKTALDLVYRRGWEDPQETDQKLSIRFVVKKDGPKEE